MFQALTETEAENIMADDPEKSGVDQTSLLSQMRWLVLTVSVEINLTMGSI